MGTGFHDLEVWREAKSLAVEIYRVTTTLRDFSLRDQLRRAAVSVPSNIAEGDETVVLTLAADPTYGSGAQTGATVTIRDKPFDAWRFSK